VALVTTDPRVIPGWDCANGTAEEDHDWVHDGFGRKRCRQCGKETAETEQERLGRWTKAHEKARVAETLRKHWLTGVICDHEAHTDVATCFCCHWRSTPQPSVGKAVERWI